MQELPILANSPRVYRERPVTPVLQPYFSSLWFHQNPSDSYAKSAVVPALSPDLVWCHEDLWVAGSGDKVIVEVVPPGATIIGMRFRPGVASACLRLSACEILGARIPVRFLWPHEGQRLADAIAGETQPDQIALRLQGELERFFTGAAFSHDPCCSKILESFAVQDRAAQPAIDRLASQLNISDRTLRRRCEHAFGFGPKTLERVLRIRRFINLAQTHPELGLSGLSSDAGYADQSHLCRECRRMTGLTPAAVLAQVAGDLQSPHTSVVRRITAQAELKYSGQA